MGADGRGASRAPRPSWPWAGVAALVAGGRLGESLGPGRAASELGVALGCTVVALIARRRPRQAAMVVACVLLGAATTERALHGLVDTPVRALADRGASAQVSGTLADDPGGSRFRTSVLVRVSELRSGSNRYHDVGRTVLVVGTGNAASRLGLLVAGDHVSVRGWLRPLDGFEARLRWRHAVATFEATDVLDLMPSSSPLAVVANRARDEIERGVRPLPDPERGLVIGFLVGDTRAVPPEVIEQFRAAGLSHLLAVSGANVAFVLALVAPVLRRRSLRGRLIITIATIVAFGAMTRWEPSVLRACAMAGIGAVAVFLGRPSAGLHVLGLAVSALVLADPFLVHSVGFLLSSGASLGILVFGPWLARHLPGPRVVRDGLAVTLAAQIGVAPVLIPVFGAVSLVSIPANLVAVPLAEPLTVVGMVGAVVSARCASAAPIARSALVPAWALARAVRGVARVASAEPLAIGPRGIVVVLLVIGAAVGTRARGRRRRRRRVRVIVRGRRDDASRGRARGEGQR